MARAQCSLALGMHKGVLDFGGVLTQELVNLVFSSPVFVAFALFV